MQIRYFCIMSDKKIKVIITGSTGMVGEGVLHECLLDSRVEQVLVINRKTCGLKHPKLVELLRPDFLHLEDIAHEFAQYDAAYLCLGVSSIGKKEDEYFLLTHSLTLHIAQLLSAQNSNMTICYVSGIGTDSSEKGRSMWARVKGKTENDLMKLAFKNVFAFRPGFIKPTKGLRNSHSFYKYVNWMFPIGRTFFPQSFCTLEEVGKAMIQCAFWDSESRIVDGKMIIALAKKGG